MDFLPTLLSMIRTELISVYNIPNAASFAESQLLEYRLNLNAKLISPRQRTVLYANHLKAKLGGIPSGCQDACKEIEMRFMSGQDVNPFLSKLAMKPEISDHLLFDWRIHHLHLNKVNDGTNYFNERSDHLLISIVDPDKVFLIDIEHHSDSEVFVKQEYLKTVLDNWPEKMNEYELKGVLAPSDSRSNDDMKKLRKAGIQSMVSINGKTYAPLGGGITMAGTSTRQALQGISIKKSIQRLGKAYDDNKELILSGLREIPGFDEAKIEFEFVYSSTYSLILVEKQTGAIIGEL